MRFLIPCRTDVFFANAGMAEVERALLRALAETGKLRLRLLASGDPGGLERLTEFCRDFASDGTLEIVPLSRARSRDPLTGVSGILVHSLPQDSWWWFHKTRALNRLPTIQYIHSLMLADFEMRLWARFWRHWRGWPPARLVAPSSITAQRAAALRSFVQRMGGFLPAVEVIPHGVDAPAMIEGRRRAGRELLGVDDERCVLLSLNRISPDKGDYRQLLLAFHVLRQLPDLRCRAHLALVGGVAAVDEGYVEELRRLVRELGLLEHVTVIKNLPDCDKKDVLAGADVFLSLATNPQESFGIVLLEALAAGLPIIATDWDGYREVIPPFLRPFLVPTVASHTVANALHWTFASEACAVVLGALVGQMKYLVGRPELRRACAAQGRIYARQFSWKTQAEKLIALCNELQAAHRKSPGTSPDKPDTATWVPVSPVDGMATTYLDRNTPLQLSAAAYRFRDITMRSALFRFRLEPRMLDLVQPAHSNPLISSALQIVRKAALHLYGNLPVLKRGTALDRLDIGNPAVPDALLTYCRAPGRGPVTLKELRDYSGVAPFICDWLVLQWIRFGVIEVCGTLKIDGGRSADR